MTAERPSRSNEAAQARLRERIAALSDDDRLREALRLHDEFQALRAAFLSDREDAAPTTTPPGGPRR